MADRERQIDELTLLLLYLTSWLEYPTEGIRHKPIQTADKIRCAWKGHDRNALERLDKEGLIFNHQGKAPIHITEEGTGRAKELLHRYGIDIGNILPANDET